MYTDTGHRRKQRGQAQPERSPWSLERLKYHLTGFSSTSTPVSTKRTFRVLRGDIWVDPSDPIPHPQTSTVVSPADQRSYSTWAAQHHMDTTMAYIERYWDDKHHYPSIRHKDLNSDDEITLAGLSAHDLATTTIHLTPTDPPQPCGLLPSIIHRLRPKPPSEPTFRVYVPNTRPLSITTPSMLSHSSSGNGGNWVSYPSVLLHETHPQRKQRLKDEDAVRSRLPRKGGRRCQPCILPYVVVVVFAAGWVVLPVLMVQEGVKGCWRWVRRRIDSDEFVTEDEVGESAE